MMLYAVVAMVGVLAGLTCGAVLMSVYLDHEARTLLEAWSEEAL